MSLASLREFLLSQPGATEDTPFGPEILVYRIAGKMFALVDWQAEPLTINLKYQSGKPIISGLKRVSKPGRRVYVPAEAIPKVQNGLGISILSTSRGILEGAKARELNVGGELLCEIW